MLDGEARVLGGTTEDELRGLGGSGERGGIGDGTDLDGEEGEEEGKNASKNGETRVHVPLEVEDDYGNDHGDDEADNPVPVLDLLVSLGGILDFLTSPDNLGSLLGKETVALALGDEGVIDANAGLLPRGLQAKPDDLVLDDKLSHGGADHDHDTGPQKPIARRGDIARFIEVPEGEEVIVTIPLLVTRRGLKANALAVVNQGGTNNTPGQERTDEHTDSRVETNQDTGADEGRSPFEVPAPRLNVQGPALVARPDVNPGERMPVVKDTNGVVRADTMNQGGAEGEQ